MTTAVYVLPAAEADIQEACDWYTGLSFILTSAFLDAIEASLVRIGDDPLQFPIVYAALRRALTRRFPYALYFRLEPEGVYILACAHTSRAPARWISRA